MKQLICLSQEAWSDSPGRTQQLITRVKPPEILYFSPAQSRHDAAFRGKGRKVKPNITVYTLPPLLFPLEERLGRLFHLDQNRLSRFIGEKMAQHRFQSPLLWTTHPAQVHLLDRLDYHGLVYDCQQEWTDVPPQWEGALAAASDVVFAASAPLAERLSPCSGNIVLLPNGAAYPLFAKAARSERPDPNRRPVLAWVGTIHSDLDLSPLVYAARSMPQWDFLLLGRRERNPYLRRLARLPNVKLLGRVPQMELPDYLSRCQVLLNFLRLDDEDGDAIPMRLYEYLSTGLPIVSMVWPDQVEPFPDVVYSAHTAEEFLTLCAHAMEEDPSFVRARRQSHGQAASWANRGEAVSRILTTAGLF